MQSNSYYAPHPATELLVVHQSNGISPQLTPSNVAWDELAQSLIQSVELTDKIKEQGIIFADFKTPHRKAENVIAYHALVLDIEPRLAHGAWCMVHGAWLMPPQPQDIIDFLDNHELASVIYTSHSHMVEADVLKPKDPSKTVQGARYRVVVPLNRAIITDIAQPQTSHARIGRQIRITRLS